MPIEAEIDGVNKFLFPSQEFKTFKMKNSYINVDDDYYIFTKDLKITL